MLKKLLRLVPSLLQHWLVKSEMQTLLMDFFLSQRLFLQSDFEAGEVEALLPVIAMLLQFSPEEVCLFLNLFSCVDEKLFQRVSKWF